MNVQYDTSSESQHCQIRILLLPQVCALLGAHHLSGISTIMVSNLVENNNMKDLDSHSSKPELVSKDYYQDDEE